MFGWIDRIFQWGVTNIGGTVVGWVRDFVRGVFGWLATLFGRVGDAWHILFSAVHAFYRTVSEFGEEVWAKFIHLYHVLIPGIIRWAKRTFVSIIEWVTDILQWIRQQIVLLILRIERGLEALLDWIVIHVWQPLRRDFLQAWHWITTRGELVFYFITHPDKLAALIFNSLLALLEREAWTVGDKLGKFFLSLVVHNLRRFVALLEDILMAVF